MNIQEMKSIRFPPPTADEEIRAILAGRKTVTRRVVKPKTPYRYNREKKTIFYDVSDTPYRPGDILYVRETFFECGGYFYYKADGRHEALEKLGIRFKWRPSIHMPREAARIFLRVTDVRAERLQDPFFKHGSTIFSLRREGIDIGEQCRECIETYGSPCCIDDESECGVLDEVRGEFSVLWNRTIKPADLAKYSWGVNPWAWVIEFERIGEEETMSI